MSRLIRKITLVVLFVILGALLREGVQQTWLCAAHYTHAFAQEVTGTNGDTATLCAELEVWRERAAPLIQQLFVKHNAANEATEDCSTDEARETIRSLFSQAAALFEDLLYAVETLVNIYPATLGLPIADAVQQTVALCADYKTGVQYMIDMTYAYAEENTSQGLALGEAGAEYCNQALMTWDDILEVTYETINTAVCQEPSIELLAPAMGAVVEGPHVLFEWSPVDTASSYTLVIRQLPDPDYMSEVVEVRSLYEIPESFFDVEYEITIPGMAGVSPAATEYEMELQPGASYAWQVFSFLGEDLVGQSEVGFFTCAIKPVDQGYDGPASQPIASGEETVKPLVLELHELERTFYWETGITTIFSDGPATTTLQYIGAGEQTVFVFVPAGAFVELGELQIDIVSSGDVAVAIAVAGPLTTVWLYENDSPCEVMLDGVDEYGLLVPGDPGDGFVPLPITIAVSGPCNVTLSELLVTFNAVCAMDVGFAAVIAEGNADALTVVWNFGDGSTSTSTETFLGPGTVVGEIVHRYDLPGTYALCCTVNDNTGQKATVIKTVQAAQSDTYCEIFKIKGEGRVRYKLPGDTKWRRATARMRFPLGTVIQSQLGTRTYVKCFEDGKRVGALVIKQLTQCETRRWVDWKKSGKKVATNLNIKIGTVRVRVDKTAIKTDMRVSTPSMVAGVVGTSFESTYDEATGTSIVLVFEGAVEVTNERTGETVTIIGDGAGTGQRATVYGDTILVETVMDMDATPGGEWDFDAMFEED